MDQIRLFYNIVLQYKINMGTFVYIEWISFKLARVPPLKSYIFQPACANRMVMQLSSIGHSW